MTKVRRASIQDVCDYVEYGEITTLVNEHWEDVQAQKLQFRVMNVDRELGQITLQALEKSRNYKLQRNPDVRGWVYLGIELDDGTKRWTATQIDKSFPPRLDFIIHRAFRKMMDVFGDTVSKLIDQENEDSQYR